MTVTGVTSTTITVHWGPVEPCADQNGAITGYSVTYGSESVSISGNSSGGMTTITGLTPSTTYSIQVAAETSAGTGVYSSAVDQGECVCEREMWSSQSLFLSVSAPALVVDSTTATTISLSWTSGGSEGVSYEVDWERVTTGECDNKDEGSVTLVGGSMTSYTVTGVEENSNYTITVTAFNDNGNEMSSPITAMTQTTG